MALSLFNPKQPPRTAQPVADAQMLMDLCSRHDLTQLAKPLQDRGVTLPQARAAIQDAQNIRDKFAAAFPSDMKAGAELADQFVMAAHGSREFAPAVGALLMDITAQASGDEIDHHQSSGQPSSAFSNPHEFYNQQD